MINFYPGPSMLHQSLPDWFRDAYDESIISYNHRSPQITDLIKKTSELLIKWLNAPSGYEVYFVSSATESWEICFESFSDKETLHFYNGSFGEKWFNYANEVKKSHKICFSIDEDPYKLLDVESIHTFESYDDLICLTHCETSNGTQLPLKFLEHCRKKFKDAIIAVDATSTMGGVHLPFDCADIWFSSVQKCFGLPSGMGIILVKKDAVEKVKTYLSPFRYNSVQNLSLNSVKNQTTYTPNILNIYFLYRWLSESKNINFVEKRINDRAIKWRKWAEDTLKDNKNKKIWLIDNVCLQANAIFAHYFKKNDIYNVKNLLKKAEKNGIILGKGYGKWAENSFRIANFPAIPDEHYEQLKNFLKQYLFN